MTQPTTVSGRPVMPPPGAAAPERLVAKLHPHARRLFWSALVLVAVAGATGYFYRNLPAPLQNWMLLSAAGAIVVLAVLLPLAVWASHGYTITTRRVIARSGLFSRSARELTHARGYQITVRRGPVQRLWRAGTLTLDDGLGAPLRLVNIPHVHLVHEVLVDQVEVSQILAHRDAQSPPPAL